MEVALVGKRGERPNANVSGTFLKGPNMNVPQRTTGKGYGDVFEERSVDVCRETNSERSPKV